MEKFVALNPAQFFLRFKETAGLTNPKRVFYLTVRELIENSLDAAEKYMILPTILVDIKEIQENIFEITCTDNGCGVEDKYIPEAFGKLFLSSKYINMQHRGLFGMGGKLIALYGQNETGKPFKIISAHIKNNKYVNGYLLKIDVNKNEPLIIKKVSQPNNSYWHGTKITVTTKGYLDKTGDIITYLEETNLINPYAEITLNIQRLNKDNTLLKYNRLVNIMPSPPKEVLPHPSSISRGDLEAMIKNSKDCTLTDFLTKSFQRIGVKTAINFLKYSKLNGNIKLSSLTDEELTKLHLKLIEYPDWMEPNLNCLGLITEKIFSAAIKNKLAAHVIYATRCGSYSGNPFAIEFAAAYGGNIKINPNQEIYKIHRYANRMPLVTEYHDAIYNTLKEVDFKRYNLEPNSPLELFVHLCSTRIPYKSQGKESIAEVDEITSKLKLAVHDVLRQLKTYITKKIKTDYSIKRLEILKKYLSKTAIFTAKGLDKPLPDVSNLIDSLKSGE